MDINDIIAEMRREDNEIVYERVIDRTRGNVSAIAAGGKHIWNRLTGQKDKNQGGFSETMRNARFSGTIKSHAKVVMGLVKEIQQFSEQQKQAGADTTELERIANGILDFFGKNEKVFGLGLGDANSEDYKNQEMPNSDTAAQTDNPGESQSGPGATNGGEAANAANPDASPPSTPTAAADATSARAGGASDSGGTTRHRAATTRRRPRKSPPPPPAATDTTSASAGGASGSGGSKFQRTAEPRGGSKFIRNYKTDLGNPHRVDWWNESAELQSLHDLATIDESRHVDEPLTFSHLYNIVLLSESAAPQQMSKEINDTVVQVYAKLGDLADSGNEDDKDFVYQMIQKLANGVPMQDVLNEIGKRSEQEKQQPPAEGVSESVLGDIAKKVSDKYSDARRKFYANQAGREAAKNGGDRKAARDEAYNNRIFEFQTRLDRELGELSLDLKTMGYKQQGSDADRLILAFRKAVSQFSKSKKEEGETSWLQRRRHGLGHMLATSATYAALRMICPATILGNKYFARAMYGAATSVIRDVSRGNLNKKSILRALAGAGIALGATIGGEMLNPSVETAYDKEFYNVNGDVYGKETVSTNPANIGTRIRSWFDKDLRGKFGTNTTEFGNPAVAQQYGKTALGGIRNQMGGAADYQQGLGADARRVAGFTENPDDLGWQSPEDAAKTSMGKAVRAAYAKQTANVDAAGNVSNPNGESAFGGTHFRTLTSNNADDVYNKMLNDPDYAGDEIVKVRMGNHSYVWNKGTDEVFGATGKSVKGSIAERIRMGAANVHGRIAGQGLGADAASDAATDAASGPAVDATAETASDATADTSMDAAADTGATDAADTSADAAETAMGDSASMSQYDNELSSLPKRAIPKRGRAFELSSRKHNDLVFGSRARAALAGYNPNNTGGPATLSGDNGVPGAYNCSQFVARIADSDPSMANWLISHPDVMKEMAKNTTSGVPWDAGKFAEIARGGGMNKALEFLKNQND